MGQKVPVDRPRVRSTEDPSSTLRRGSAFAIVEHVCLKRERWVGSAPLIAEKQFRRIRGYKQREPSSSRHWSAGFLCP